MPGKASLIKVSSEEQSALEAITRQSTASQQLVERVQIILLAGKSWTNQAIASWLRCKRDTVRLWRGRWAEGCARLAAVNSDPKALRQAILAVLRDRPRPGAPPKFSPEQVTQIIAVACEPPSESDRPITHWTPSELADEARRRGIVESISARHVGRFLKDRRAQAASQRVLASQSARGSGGFCQTGSRGL